MHLNKGKTLSQCLHNRTAYAMNPEKTNEQELVKSYECDPKYGSSVKAAVSNAQRILDKYQGKDVCP